MSQIEINNQYLTEELQKHFEHALLDVSEPYGLLTIVVKPEAAYEIIKWAKENAALQMNFLTDITGIHFPDNTGAEIGVIYHIHSLVHNLRLRIKAFLPVKNPKIKSLTSLYVGADWPERETYDFYGVIFEEHPNLKRILNVDEMNYFPMRKEYPLEDQHRTDKEDKYFGR